MWGLWGEHERGGAVRDSEMFPASVMRTSLFHVFSADSKSAIIQQMSQVAPCWSFHNNNSVCQESFSQVQVDLL